MDEAAKHMRSLVVDVLSLMASAETQRRYQHAVPGVSVPNELFNQWDDAYHPKHEQFVRVFSAAELQALESFAALVERVAASTPQTLPALEDFIASPHWAELSDGARDTLKRLSGTR